MKKLAIYIKDSRQACRSAGKIFLFSLLPATACFYKMEGFHAVLLPLSKNMQSTRIVAQSKMIGIRSIYIIKPKSGLKLWFKHLKQQHNNHTV